MHPILLLIALVAVLFLISWYKRVPKSKQRQFRNKALLIGGGIILFLALITGKLHPLFAAHKGVTGLGPLYTPFDEVLETADIITMHAPLMPATRNMIAMPEFRQMKRRPIIVNTARGGLIDEAALVQALDEGQRAVAVLGGEIPFDVLAGPGRKGSLSEFSGIRASSLNGAQQTLLWELVEEFAANAGHAAAHAQLEKIRADGLDALHFAWIGPADDPAARYYYRVHGPSVLIEYIVEEGVGGSAANHVHSIMRDPGNDYGEDWLGKHYEEHHRRQQE